MKINTQEFRPLSAKCAGVCTATFVMLFCACMVAYASVNGHGESQIIWLLPIFIAVLHCVLVAFSVFRWNSWVYLHNDRIVQIQWGKEIVIPYSEISDVKMDRMPPYPATITVFFDHRKISFDSSKDYIFLEYCTNIKINTKIAMLQE